MMKSVKINGTVGKAEIEVDGKRLKGVIEAEYKQNLEETIPCVTFTCICKEVNLEFDVADVKFRFPNNWVTIEKGMPEVDVPVLALVKDKNGMHQEVLTRQYFEETDAVYEGVYWCSYRTSNIEALGINKVIAWQPLPSEEMLGM